MLLTLISSLSLPAQTMKLWYDKPAASWWEALPVGNGHLAAMAYGGTTHEEIQLNEDTFWSGGPHNNNKVGAYAYLNPARELIFAGKEKEAEKLINSHFFTGQNGMRYLPVASLLLDIEGGNDSACSDFYRDLNLEDGTAITRFTIGNTHVVRRVFASLVQRAIIIRIEADHPLTMALSFQSPLPTGRSSVQAKSLSFSAKGEDMEGVKAALRVKAKAALKTDGKLGKDSSCLIVTGAKVTTVYLSAATNFVNYQDVSGNENKRVDQYLDKAMAVAYPKLLQQHIEKYKSQFDRVTLTLPTDTNSNKPTDRRLVAYHNGHDEALAALLFHYGRYLVISGSQPGSQPTNLQGKWNTLMKPAWDSKYTVNINTEMNYWPTEVTQLSENGGPLFKMIEDLSHTGRLTAQTLYHARGWVCHHNTDLWRIAGPVDYALTGMWPNGGGWLIQHLWQHYLFTGDKAFLRKYYPVMKGATDFYLSHLVKHPKNGWMVLAPSMSPEHRRGGGKNTTITAGCAMDTQIAFDAMENTRLAAKVLGVDGAYQDSLRAMTAQLPPMQVGQYYQLQEWLEDIDDPTDEHRHISQLYALYPSNQITPEQTPELFQAARNTLLQRGDQATGWSLSWKINMWARMREGNHAYKIIRNLLSLLPNDNMEKQYPDGRCYPNLLTAHPPFQIDCNYGYTAGVAEMLVQSHDGAIHLLPALPDAWHKGSVKGLCARGGFVVDIAWEGTQLTDATLRSTLGGTVRIRSYVPLQGEGLRPASGHCPNDMLKAPVTKPFLHSDKIVPQQPIVSNAYEYDLDTQVGGVYYISRK